MIKDEHLKANWIRTVQQIRLSGRTGVLTMDAQRPHIHTHTHTPRDTQTCVRSLAHALLQMSESCKMYQYKEEDQCQPEHCILLSVSPSISCDILLDNSEMQIQPTHTPA